MDLIALLKKAQLLNKAKKPRAALNILKHLYKLDANNINIILEVVTAFENLGEWAKARSMLGKGIRLFPKNIKLWIRLSHIYKVDRGKEAALKAIDNGLSYSPDNLSLLIHKSYLLADLARVNEMRSLIDDTILSYPDYKKQILIQRAAIYQKLSLHPANDEEELVTDSLGKVYAAKPLKKAINDLNDAMDCDEDDYQIPLKLARIYKQLNNIELAMFTYDDALSALDSGAETLRISIQQEKDDCLKSSSKDSRQIKNSQQQDILKIPQKESVVLRDKVTASNSQETRVNQLTAVKDRGSQQKTLVNNPVQKKVISIAQNIMKNAVEPNAAYTPAELEKSARKFCDQVEEEIKKVGFIRLGDFEAKGLNQYLGKRVSLRLFVSGSRQICAAAFEIKPAKPSFINWVLQLIIGKWKIAQFVELQSETLDGVFKITNNSGEINPFDASNHVKIKTLAGKSTVYDIVLEHKIRLQKHSQSNYKQVADLKEFFAFQERIRRAKNVYRESVGFVTDEELKLLLGKQFEKLSSDIRYYLEKITHQTSNVKS